MNQKFLIAGRTLCWFSCGAASAVAAKLATEQYGAVDELEVIYCDTLAYEHPDNYRFMDDVSSWIGRPIKILSSGKFRDIYDVFLRERYLKGRHGAPCARALKINVRKDYQEPWDWHVFGFTADEEDRIDSFERENPSLKVHWLLRERSITKTDCYRMITAAGIELPYMYKLGYRNNNCIGCVKGGAGYWNKIRRDFPYVFAQMSRTEREIGHALVRIKGKPCYLDELPADAGRYESEPEIKCGPQCVMPKEEID